MIYSMSVCILFVKLPLISRLPLCFVRFLACVLMALRYRKIFFYHFLFKRKLGELLSRCFESTLTDSLQLSQASQDDVLL